MAMGHQPFKRAIAMQESIASILAKGGGDLIIRMAIQALGEYKSRGKGSRHSKVGRNWFRGLRSKYAPHQGSQERFRRFVGGWAKTGTTKAAVVSDPAFYQGAANGAR